MLEKKKNRTAASPDLSISIPSLFQCPISLDVMKSPVSLSTGITYDRSSIQKWLESGHETCPATMQLLNSKDFVPNHNLHRLIQIWSDSTSVVISKQQARDLIANFSVPNLEKLVCFGRESDDNRRFVAKELMLSRDCVSSLLLFLRSGSSEAKIAAANVLEIIAGNAESKMILAEKEGLVDELMNFVEEETDRSLMESVLSCFISLSTVKLVNAKLVRLGIVGSIAKLLTNHTSSLSVISIERMLKLLETVSSCKDGRNEICNNSTCVAAVLNKVMKVSKVATEHAVTILWIVCCLFRNEKAIEAVARNNGLTKVLIVMQSNCSASVRQMAGDVLKMLRLNSKSCLWSYDNKMTNITSIFD